MSNDAGGFGSVNPPPPGHNSPGQPPPGYPGYPGYPAAAPQYYGYPPQTYPPQAYPPQQGYPQYPGYPQQQQGYQPYGYPQFQGYPAPSGYPSTPPDLKPGVIPLRPLTLSEIFNGAVAYVRVNPKATLGLTAVVVVVAQILTLLLQFSPLAATGQLDAGLDGGEVSQGAEIASAISGLAGGLISAVSLVLLSGMLTVVVGRAVFGARIDIGEAWQRLRPRLLALIGFTALETLGILIIVGVVVLVIYGLAQAVSGTAAFLVGAPLALIALALLLFVFTVLSFAPVLIVLERLSLAAAVTRSFALVKKDFWRVLGITLLAQLVAGLISLAVAIPFGIGGQLFLLAGESAGGVIISLILSAIGGAVGQIVTAPFTSGVTVLLYTDRRIRGEGFDLVLRTGAATAQGAPDDSTDHLWLTRQA